MSISTNKDLRGALFTLSASVVIWSESKQTIAYATKWSNAKLITLIANLEISIQEKQVNFLTDNQINYENCILNLIKNDPKNFWCFPTLFNFIDYIRNLPACDKIEDVWHFLITIWSSKKHDFIKCLKPKKATLYEPTVFITKKSKNETKSRSMDFRFFGGSNLKKIEEEIYVISTTSFIGSIGGSLGLLFGFSILSCCSEIWGKFVKLFNSQFWAREVAWVWYQKFR